MQENLNFGQILPSTVGFAFDRIADQSQRCLGLIDPFPAQQHLGMAEAQLAAADFGALCRVSPEAMGSLLRQKNIFLT